MIIKLFLDYGFQLLNDLINLLKIKLNFFSFLLEMCCFFHRDNYIIYVVNYLICFFFQIFVIFMRICGLNEFFTVNFCFATSNNKKNVEWL